MLTREDWEASRDFLLYLADLYPGGWKRLMADAEIDPDTDPNWRYAKKKDDPASTGSTPEALNLLKILRTIGVLDEGFRLPDTVAEMAEVQRHSADAVEEGERLSRQARDDRARDASRRSS